MNYRFCIIVFLILSKPLSAQLLPTISEDTLALVDRHPITSRDLYERISMMPYEDKLTDRNFTSVKRKAVESLVGEYILSQVNNPPDPSDWRKSISETVLERMFMRDALFKREIREKAALSEPEIADGLKMFALRKVILSVKLPDGEQGSSLFAQLNAGRKQGMSRYRILSSASLRYDTLLIALGSIDSLLENAAYRLKDSAGFIGPLNSPVFGRIAISWLRDESNPAAKDIAFSDRRKSVTDILRDRKESQLQRIFFDSILRGQQMTADTALFLSTAQQFRTLMLRDTISRKVPTGYRYLPTDLYELMQQFEPQLDSPVVRGTFGVLKLGIFLEHLYYYDFTVPSLKPRSFTVSFFQMLRAITEGEMVASEAERKGLRYDADVRRDVAIWNNHNHSRTAEYRIADTVQTQDWEPYWSLWRRSQNVIEENMSFSIQEVLLKDSTSAGEVKKALLSGADMDSIARRVTIRKEWKLSGGRSGWFAFRKYPELSAKLMMLPAGELSGPIRLNEGYSLVTLLGRRIAGDSPYIDSLLQREALRMRTKRQLAAVSSSVASLARERNVKFFYDRIDRAEIADINMLTRRIIGFGGRINASPYLVPQWEWVEQWKKMQNINP
ncbi:MAG: peptidylprolyl isomerase [Bacteroidota bacterium]